jgi:chemotaxis signal transduction protein
MADQDDISSEGATHVALRDRLTMLERELSALRRELSYDVAPAALPDTPLRVLTTRIGSDVYGISIDAIVEILRYVRLTHVPEVAPGIVGALNLRGAIHAVLDARQRFGLAASAPRLGTSIVLVSVGRHRIGLLVDRVLEVITVQVDQLEAAGGPLASSGVFALATVGAQLVQLIDTQALLHASAMRQVTEVLESIPAPGGSDGSSHG